MKNFGWEKYFVWLKHFFCPEFNRKSAIRMAVIAAVSVIFFLIFRPCFIMGSSMEPGYSDHGVVLSFTLRYTFVPVKRGDIVIVSYFGKRYLLKRVVALAGDVVEFRSGKLLVNGKEQEEPYVKNPCRWTTSPVKVEEGFCFIVGDNRDQPQIEHIHGQVSLDRITGGPLW